MNQSTLWLGYDITTEPGPLLQPISLQFWNEKNYSKAQPLTPFTYRTDALVGLSLILVNQNLKSPFVTPEMNYSFAHFAWEVLEPHFEIYHMIEKRNKPIVGMIEKKINLAKFEGLFESAFSSLLTDRGIQFDKIAGILDGYEELEEDSGEPLLFNFNYQMSSQFLEKAMAVHSFFFNLRTLMAMDYNSQIKDASHESLRVDSITDYFPRAEYILNDALLFTEFKNLRNEMPEKTFEKLSDRFFQYCHNGVCLMQSLPKAFKEKLDPETKEEVLYQAQMNWLLGTPAGLMYRIREELYGLQQGYTKVFFRELHRPKNNKTTMLSLNCRITEAELGKKSA